MSTLRHIHVRTRLTRGFTIFLAVLVSSLALAVGLAIYDLTVRELDLTIASRESHYAIYAADTGVECALYWDSKFEDANGTAFATSTRDIGVATGSSNVLCNGQNIVSGEAPLNVAWTITTTNAAATTTFQFSLGGVAGTVSNPCATVIVSKYGTPQQTTITSNGFNNCIINSPSRLQRTMQVNY